MEFALAHNGALEAKFWDWKSAIEQIPQDGTEPTNLALSASLNITRGKTSPSQAVISAGNDPMTDILLPPKLSVAARRALETARAAGARFRKAGWELHAAVLSAAADYSLTAELIAIEQSNLQLLQNVAANTEVRKPRRRALQRDVLKSRIEIDLSASTLANLQSQLPGQRASLNALLGRPVEAPLSPTPLPSKPLPITETDEQLLTLAAQQNPELAALARDQAAREEAIRLARLQYLPDVSVTAGSDLAGIAQTLGSTITVPLLRHEAIDAAVAQATANSRSASAMLAQSRSDISARLLLDLFTLRDTTRQLDVLDQSLLPRAAQSIDLTRSSYETGASSLLDFLEAERFQLTLRRLSANLLATRARSLSEAESITATKW